MESNCTPNTPFTHPGDPGENTVGEEAWILEPVVVFEEWGMQCTETSDCANWGPTKYTCADLTLEGEGMSMSSTERVCIINSECQTGYEDVIIDCGDGPVTPARDTLVVPDIGFTPLTDETDETEEQEEPENPGRPAVEPEEPEVPEEPVFQCNEDFTNLVLGKHNELRALHGVPDMALCPTACNNAEKFANEMESLG